MNWLDGIIIIILGTFIILGLRRGLIKSLVLLLGMVLAIFLTGKLQDSLADELSFIDSEGVAKIVAFAIILIPTFLIVILLIAPRLGLILQKIAKVTFSPQADRVGGALLGFLVGWFICSALIVLLARYAALPVDLPANGVNGSANEQLNLEGTHKFMYDAIDGSSIASFQVDSFHIFNLLPGEFDAAHDFFD
jgi:membrane protein required for colicin V production